MYIFYNHSGSGNHGCEAIVRSSVNILQKPVTLYSMHRSQDFKYGVDEVCSIIEDNDIQLKRGSLKWLVAALQTKLTNKYDLAFRFRKNGFIKNISKGDICFSIGGDNYCYEGTEAMAAINNALRCKGAKTVLWGCSVEPGIAEDPAIAKDLANFDLITARESISYNVLKKVNPNTVFVADPAFTLERRDLPLPEGWIEGNMIGLNISPLIIRREQCEGVILESCRNLMRRILETTDFGVALIPHVVWDDNDDRKPLGVLYDEFKDSGRVVLIDDHNCMELKGYIARCRMFIGARTHATIAAYSSCVPTLVLGYSVKSRGIARDLFGTEENYVIPVQSLSTSNELIRGFEWLAAHETQIRGQLECTMHEYKNRACEGVKELKKLR